MNRRGFLGAILAAACAPAVVKASSIMRIAPERGLVLINRDAVVFGDGTVVTGFDLAMADGDMDAALRLRREALDHGVAAGREHIEHVMQGRIGMVDRYSIFESKITEPHLEVLARIEDAARLANLPLVYFDEAAEIPPEVWDNAKLYPAKIWRVSNPDMTIDIRRPAPFVSNDAKLAASHLLPGGWLATAEK